MSTETFKTRAGTGIGTSVEDERMMLLGAYLDKSVKWVTMPDDLGGGRANVLEYRAARCPRIACDCEGLLLVLDATLRDGSVGVYECARGEYLWMCVQPT
jgi:hypothetical protein